MSTADIAAQPPLFVEDLAHVLKHTATLWEEVRGQRIFITGGTGFFGMWLLESFAYANDELRLGASVHVLTRHPAAFKTKAPHLATRSDIHLLSGDVRNFEFPEGVFPYVIHAGTTSSAPVEPLEMFETIVDGTRRVLEFASTHGTRKLLFVSSGAVYGQQPADLQHVPEDYRGAPDPLDPKSAYGEGKRAAELLCALAARKHGIEVKIARCFAFVGPHLPLNAHFAIGNFIRDALIGGPIRVEGDGTPLRSYLYAADLVIWLWTILSRGLSSIAYNVGSMDARSMRTIAELTRDILASKATLQIAKAPTGQSTKYVPDGRLTQNSLGLSQLVPLNSAIVRTAQWYAPKRGSSRS